MTARRQFQPPRAPLATLAARAAAGIGAVHGSGVDHPGKPNDHKLPTRAFIQQEAHLALPSNCLDDPDHLRLLHYFATDLQLHLGTWYEEHTSAKHYSKLSKSLRRRHAGEAKSA